MPLVPAPWHGQRLAITGAERDIGILGGFPRPPCRGVLILSAYAYQERLSLVPAIEHNSEGIESFCVMQMARSLINEAPTNKMMASGKKTSKAPKLHEAYKHFFERDLDGAHDAMTDCLACKDIFFKIREIEAPKKAA